MTNSLCTLLITFTSHMRFDISFALPSATTYITRVTTTGTRNVPIENIQNINYKNKPLKSNTMKSQDQRLRGTATRQHNKSQQREVQHKESYSKLQRAQKVQ
jgi:hypothetical protein